jgi:hypothetical protein
VPPFVAVESSTLIPAEVEGTVNLNFRVS